MKNCCLLSKSWIPRARGHLFKTVRFYSRRDLGSWKKTFPDRSTSPARYTTNLVICSTERVTAADAEEGGWIRAFYQVVDWASATRHHLSSHFTDPRTHSSSSVWTMVTAFHFREFSTSSTTSLQSHPIVHCSVIRMVTMATMIALVGSRSLSKPPFTGSLMLHMLVGVDLVGL